MRLPVFALWGLLLCACSFDYGEEQSPDLDRETPTKIFVDVKQTTVVDNHKTTEFKAQTAELFEKRKEARLSGLNFVEFDQGGGKVTEGRADLATINTEKNDAQVSGQVSVWSVTQKTRISAENLTWTNDQKLLVSPLDEAVTVEQDGGSSFIGKGFQANFKLGQLSFSGGVTGTMTEKKDTEASNAPAQP